NNCYYDSEIKKTTTHLNIIFGKPFSGLHHFAQCLHYDGVNYSKQLKSHIFKFPDIPTTLSTPYKRKITNIMKEALSILNKTNDMVIILCYMLDKEIFSFIDENL